jgi:glyoxylase-like metal-dependent hydrolase (beta-lactamase superfamily II)
VSGVSAQPRPAELPLAGGREGATVRVHPVLTGEMLSPPGLLERPGGPLTTLRGLDFGRAGDSWVWLPIPAFLIEHPGAGAIVVDTGLHPSVALDPVQSFGRLAGRVNRFRMEPEQALAHQLRARGVAPADVGVVVMTHLHTDHASGVSEFPGATFVVDQREWDSATTRRGLTTGYHHPQFDYGFDWRTIDYDAPEVDSFASFGHSVDLLGDGSVRLVATPGHTLGHQSVVLRLRGGELLLTGDAVYERRGLEADVTPLLMHDEHLFWRSLRDIRRYIAQTPEAVVITGHDRRAWPTLQPAYE